jgi:5-methylcytosine-specific restriction endonuclease McrA
MGLTQIAFDCAYCGQKGLRQSGDYNRKVAAGKALHCSKRCAWDASKARAEVAAQNRAKSCETCGSNFIPRQTQLRAGGGRFCSQKCNTSGREALNDPAVKRLAKDRVKELRANGIIKAPRGPDNKQWKGGHKASVARRIADGRAAEQLRKYRQANPDKVREFSQRRAGRKLDKLPYGTLPKLREAQGDKCAICATRLHGKGHLDHVVPLAKGGKHLPGNLQFLCAPCNLHKSDKDPIAHMQSLGRLL